MHLGVYAGQVDIWAGGPKPGRGKLTWGRAPVPHLGVFARGEGYGIPIYVLWRNYKCWRRCRDGEPEDWEEDTSYTMKDESGLRIGALPPPGPPCLA